MREISWQAMNGILSLGLRVPMFTEDDENLYVFYVDGALSLMCRILKAKELEDLQDFNDNYRPAGNREMPFLSSDVFNGVGLSGEFDMEADEVMQAKVGEEPLAERKGVWLQAHGEASWGFSEESQPFFLTQEVPTFLPHGAGSPIFVKAHSAMVLSLGEAR